MSPSTVSCVFDILQTWVQHQWINNPCFPSDLQWDLWRSLWTGSVRCRSSFGMSLYPGHGGTSERCGLSDWLFLCYHWYPRWQSHHQKHKYPLYQWPNWMWMEIKFCKFKQQLEGGRGHGYWTIFFFHFIGHNSVPGMINVFIQYNMFHNSLRKYILV